MFKNILKSILFATIITFGFSNNLKAEEITPIEETSIEENQNTENQLIEKDEYIENFLKTIDTEYIKYDGKNLTLYVSPPYKAYIISLISSILLTSGGLIFLNKNNKAINPKKKREYLALSAILFLFDALFLIIILRHLYYENIKTPFLTINDKSIKNWNNEKEHWKHIKRMNIYEIFANGLRSDTIIKLCDKYLNEILTINQADSLSPISSNNLIKIFEHYINNKKDIK